MLYRYTKWTLFCRSISNQFLLISKNLYSQNDVLHQPKPPRHNYLLINHICLKFPILLSDYLYRKAWKRLRYLCSRIDVVPRNCCLNYLPNIKKKNIRTGMAMEQNQVWGMELRGTNTIRFYCLSIYLIKWLGRVLQHRFC